LSDDPVLNARGYEILRHVQAGAGSSKTILGTPGKCRFCGGAGTNKFRQIAHTIPEGLGNHWILSADECDHCNKLFSVYDDSLCKCVGSILTVGGTTGKRGKVRQTGPSRGGNNIRHTRSDGQRRISFQMLSKADGIVPALGSELKFWADGKMMVSMPTPPEGFVPRHAYKGLVKIGLALLPETEFQNFEKLFGWLLDKEDVENFPFLDVSMSFGSLGNAPPTVSATLLKRKSSDFRVPYLLLFVTAGSICWQIDLMPDALDDELGLASFGCVNMSWSSILGPEGSDQIIIPYSDPRHFDWSSRSVVRSPITAIRQHFDQHSNEGRIEFEWRDMQPG
jgi:hypothetical protein